MDDGDVLYSMKKNNKKITPIFIFRVIVKIHRKLANFGTKMTKNENRKFGCSPYSADSGSFM